MRDGKRLGSTLRHHPYIDVWRDVAAVTGTCLREEVDAFLESEVGAAVYAARDMAMGVPGINDTSRPAP